MGGAYGRSSGSGGIGSGGSVALVGYTKRGSRRCSMCSTKSEVLNRRGCSPRSIRRFAGRSSIEAQDAVLDTVGFIRHLPA